MMAIKCGNCFHHRSGGRCKNKNASTYNVMFDSESHGCQMHLTSYLKPLGWGFSLIGGFVTIALLIAEILCINGTNGSGGSNNNGFEL
jgi:hypothetical protein